MILQAIGLRATERLGNIKCDDLFVADRVIYPTGDELENHVAYADDVFMSLVEFINERVPTSKFE